MGIDRINLIPADELKSASTLEAARIAVFAGVGVVAVLVGLSTLQHFQLKRKTDTYNRLAAENEIISRTLASLNDQATSQDKTSNQMQAAKQFLQTRVIWTELFKELSLLVPAKVWLTQFSNSVKDGQSKVVLVGEASSQDKVAEFLGALEGSYFFKNSNLQYSEKLVGYAPALFRFSIESSVAQFKVREEKKVEPAK